ncbi:MAG TPA: PAS domain S-box protein [Gemmatimonadaceae bacterium]|nr:PAS domain S-box protein [Gemmatimonadaceae bacterium]
MDAPSPSNIANEARLAILRATGLLDSPREESFDRLTRLASVALHAPMALMTLVDAERQFFKSCVGLPEPWATRREGALDSTLCQHVVASRAPLVVADTRQHPLARASRAITEMHIVSYAGVPLRTLEGHVIGAFSGADRAPREWQASDVALLEELAAAAMHEIELHGALRAAARHGTEPGEQTPGQLASAAHAGAIVESTPIAIGIIQDGLFLYVSPSLATMFGYSAEELLAGTSVFDLTAERERPALRHAFERILDEGAGQGVHEFTGLHRDGSVLEIELRGNRRVVSGRPIVVAVFLDITARKTAEAGRLRTAEQLRALTENAWDIIHMLSPDDVILYMSPSVERVLGYRPEEMVGRHGRDFVHPEDLPRVDDALRQDMSRPGAQRQMDLRLRHRDGSWREVEVVGRVVRDASGATVAIVNTHDVTEQRRAERDLRARTASVELLEFVATAANAATSIEDAILPCLERICRYHDWSAAHIDLLNATGQLVSTGAWYLKEPDRLVSFREQTDKQTFVAGQRLPGSVLESGKAVWVPDVTEDPAFTRQAEARAAGLRGGIACPMLIGTEVVGVLEFFADRVLAVDQPLLEVLAHVGTQLGRVVERGRAREALQKSEDRSRAIMEMAHDAFIATEADDVICEWNAQAEAIFGWTRDEALGRSMTEMVIPPTRRAVHRRCLRQLLRARGDAPRSRRLELEVLHRDGHEFPAELSISAIPLDGGHLIASFLHDITARKQAEERLRCSEERYDLVARATSDIVWDWNVVTGVLTWNKALQRTCRYRQEQIGSTMEWWYSRIHPADRERVVTGTHAVLNGAVEFWSDEYRFARGDGTYATVLARGHVVRNNRGEAMRMIGSMVDITERKLEEQAQRFIAQASALLDTSLDQDVILNSLARLAVPTLADFCIIDVLEETGVLQRTARVHADPSKEPLLRENAPQLGDAGADRELILKVVRTRQPVLVRDCGASALEALRLAPAMRERLRRLGASSLMVVPLVTREQVLGVITLGAGDSGRHYDLMDLLTAEQLARRAARTIDNGRLYDKAQRAIRARDEVLAVVSHDLRSPLSTIGLSTSMLVEESAARRESPSRYIGMIQRAAEQANTMIRNLLDISSIEADHFAVNRTKEDVVALARQAHELLAPLAEQHSIRFDLELPDERILAMVDVNQLHRVFANLVTNALKFTPQGGRVSLGAEEVDGTVRFSVSDSGRGIPPDQLPHLFDRFWQGLAGDRRGAGLGLSIVRGIVEAHGGRIWVESREGQGTTVAFTLPLLHEPAGGPTDVPADATVVPESVRQGSG